MKYLILSTVLFVISLSVSAQVFITPEAGTSFSNLIHNQPESGSVLIRPTVGISLSGALSPEWGRGIAVRYFQKGSQGTTNNGTQTFEMDFIDISIMLTRYLNKLPISFDASVTASYLISRRWKIDGERQELPGNLRSADFSLDIAANVVISNNIHMTARFSKGLVNTSLTELEPLVLYTHNTISLTIAKTFRYAGNRKLPRFYQ